MKHPVIIVIVIALVIVVKVIKVKCAWFMYLFTLAPLMCH